MKQFPRDVSRGRAAWRLFWNCFLWGVAALLAQGCLIRLFLDDVPLPMYQVIGINLGSLAIIVLVVTLAFRAERSRIRRERALRRDFCTCGYHLAGLPVKDGRITCPECAHVTVIEPGLGH